MATTVVTTLMEWRVVWFPDAQAAALATTVYSGTTVADVNTASARHIHVSRSYTLNEPVKATTINRFA